MLARLWPIHAALLVLLACGCSRQPDSDSNLRTFGSEPFRTPKYPPHAVVPPSVPPSSFSLGLAYDWEHPTPPPAHMSQSMFTEVFANARAFDETSAWITKAMEKYVPSNHPPDETTRYSDFHFRGCIFEWHEEWASGPEHVNESNYSVNLADADMTGIMPLSRSLRLGWHAQNNPVLFRAWEKEDGHWKSPGEQLQRTFASKTFSVSPENMAEPLAFAFLHAARLCGARFPPRH